MLYLRHAKKQNYVAVRSMGLLPDTQICGLPMRQECWERFPYHRGLAIPTCITARASCTCRDAWLGRQLAVSFEVGGGGNRFKFSIPRYELDMTLSKLAKIKQYDKVSEKRKHDFQLNNSNKMRRGRISALTTQVKTTIPPGTYIKIFWVRWCQC